MTTLTYIAAWAGLIALCIGCFALGWCEGKRQGELDGYEEAADEFRRRCAND